MKITDRAANVRQLLGNHPGGLIRHEIASLMKIPLSSVCSLTNGMLSRGEIAETGETRKSPYGQQARVLTIPKSDRGEQ